MGAELQCISKLTNPDRTHGTTVAPCDDVLVSNLSSIVSDARAVLRAQWSFRGAQLGPRVRCFGRPNVRLGGEMILDDRVRIMSDVATTELGVGPGGTLHIGSRTFVNYGTSIAAGESVTIGANCLIGTHVLIADNDFHRLEADRRNEAPDTDPVVLADNVWIGQRAMVLKGVTIGENSVVAAGSVVTKDVPANTVVGGVPARILRDL